MKRRMLAIVLAASWILVFHTHSAEAKFAPGLLDNVLKGAVDVVDQTVGGVSDSVNQTVSGATNALEQTVSGTLNQTQQAVQDTLDVTGKAAGGLLEPVTTPTADSAGSVVNTVEQVVKDANVIVNETVDIPLNTVPQATGALNGKAADPVGTLLEETGQTVKAVDQTVKNATENVGSIVQSVGPVTEGAGNTVGEVVETVADTVKETVKPITRPGSGGGTPSLPTVPIVPTQPTNPGTQTPTPSQPDKEPGKGNGQEPVSGQHPSAPMTGTETTVPISTTTESSGRTGASNEGRTTVNPSEVAGQAVHVQEAQRIVAGEVLNPVLPENQHSLTEEPSTEPNQSVSIAGYGRDDAEELSLDAQPADMTSERLSDESAAEVFGVFPNEKAADTSSRDGGAAQIRENNTPSATSSAEFAEPKGKQAAPLAPREGRQPQAPVVPGLLSEGSPTRGASGPSQGGSGFAGPQPPIAQLYTGFMPTVSDPLYRLKATSDTEGNQWINAPPFSPPKNAPFLT